MTQLNGCQIPCLPKISVGLADVEPQSVVRRLKRMLAVPWNYYGKKFLKRIYLILIRFNSQLFKRQASSKENVIFTQHASLAAGDWVRVRSLEDIQSTLNPWKELKGCAFLPYMVEFCGTTQRVLQPVQRFLDERDYKVKKARGVVLLEGVICKGTPVFGRCDRCCHLFWREEWLEKLDQLSI